MTPERMTELNWLMQHIPTSHRYRWCTAGACACMGCVNQKLKENGFTQHDHLWWVNNHPRGDTNTIHNTYWIRG